MTECKHEWTGKYTGFPANPVKLYCPLCGKKMSWTEAMRRLNNYVDLEAENEMLREATNKLSAELDVAQGNAMNKGVLVKAYRNAWQKEKADKAELLAMVRAAEPKLSWCPHCDAALDDYDEPHAPDCPWLKWKE